MTDLSTWHLPHGFVAELTRDLSDGEGLARLGEELDVRERLAPVEHHWPSDAADDDTRALWRELLRSTSVTSAAAFARTWSVTTRACFRGVAAVLHLPPGVGDTVAEAAAEQFDLAVAMAHRDIAARLVETSGEPIAALAGVLGETERDVVESCIARRPAWARPVATLRRHVPVPTPASCADAIVFVRVVERLRNGELAPHAMGPPGWGIVVANRARMRGRLRAVAAGAPGLSDAIERLDALHARTTATVGRFAWDWAWREARSSFGFDPARLRPPACVVASAPPSATFDPAAVRTFLLHVAGCGAWNDLEGWLRGARGRDLGRTFYRCLAAFPGPYDALRDHLVGGARDALLPDLLAIAERIAALPEDRNLRRRIAEILSPVWRGLPLPGHHLPRFRRGMITLSALRRPGPSPESG